MDALKCILNTKSAPTSPAKDTLTIEDIPPAGIVAKSIVAADSTKVPSNQTRQSIPTLDVITPVTEPQKVLENNQRLHVLIVDDNDINLKVCIYWTMRLYFRIVTCSLPFSALSY